MSDPRPMKVAVVLPDDRDEHGRRELPRPLFGPAPATLLAGMAMVPELEVHILSCERIPMPDTPVLAKNVFFHAVPVSRWAYMRSLYVGSVLGIRKVLRKIRPHVVHGQGTERYAGLAAAFSGFPSLLTIHGNMRAVARALGARPFSFHGVTGWLEALAVRQCGGVICLSSYTRRQVAPLARRLWDLPNAVGEAYFQVERRSDPIPRLLCAGTICAYKNQNALIRALEPLAARAAFRLVFAGTLDQTAYSREFQQLVAERPWCEYLGRVAPDQIRAELSRAFLLVHPSLEDNCPMVILEAMAAGVPVVASTCGGIPELVRPGQTGFLCAPDDGEAFRSAIEQLLSDPATANSLGAHARAIAQMEFEPETVARKHLTVYREFLGERQG